MNKKILLETIKQNPRYNNLYKTDICFKNSIDCLIENDFSMDSTVLIIADLCELVKANQIALAKSMETK